MKFPTINTERLILDRLREEDSESLFFHFSTPEVVEYYDLEAFTNQEQALNLINLFEKRFENELGIRWSIRLKDSGQFIGTCGFNSWNTQEEGVRPAYLHFLHGLQ